MMLGAPAILLTAAMTLLAVIIVLWPTALAQIRRPAETGRDGLSKAQGAEPFLVFLPALWLAEIYFQGWIPPLIGLIWCLGRIVMAARTPVRDFAGWTTTIATLVLVLLALFGIVQAAATP